MKNYMSYEEGKDNILRALFLLKSRSIFYDYGLCLYLIHARIAGLLSEYKAYLNTGKAIISNALYSTHKTYEKYEYKLFDVYRDQIIRGDDRIFTTLVPTLTAIQDEWFKENQARLFDDLINYFSEGMGNSGEFIQDLALTRFINAINIYDGKGTLYNPFAGSATYGTELSGDGVYLGQELNPNIWAIGTMRLIAHSKDASHFYNDDSIDHWNFYQSEEKEYQDRLFDCIVATPPFGLKASEERLCGMRKVEDFLIDIGLSSISLDHGIAIFVLPQNVTFNGGQSRVERELYIKRDQLDTVIMLPSGALRYSSVSTVILIFSNKKKEPGFVRMVDGSSFVTKNTNRKKTIQYDALQKAILDSDPIYVKKVTNEAIIENDYNILPSLYFKVEEPLPDGFNSYKLSDIATIYNGERCTESDTIGKVVKVGTLSSNPFKYTLDIDSIPDEAINNTSLYRKITSEVILLSKVRELKPTLVKASEAIPIYISSSIAAIKVINPEISINCLIYTLSQTGIIQSGNIIPNNTLSTIQSIVLNMPISLSAQEAHYSNAERAYKMAQVQEFGLEEIIASQKKDFIAVLRRRKHDINTYVGDIRNRIQGLNKFLVRENLDKLIYSARQNTTVGDNLDTIILKLNQMGQYLEHIADENNYGIPQKVDLCSKLKEIKNGPNYKVECFLDQATLSLVNIEDNDEIHAFVNIAPLDLDHILLNIISNAYKHGFTDPDSKDYCIQILLVYNQQEDRYDITIRNNGNPLPEGMNIERYGIPGEKAGQTQGNGEGGAIVKDTIEHYGGHLDVILNEPEELFPVTIIFNLPRYDGE